MRRRNRSQEHIEGFDNFWPGFVDAFATVIMVITFLLTLFVVSQHFLNDALVDKDDAIGQFRQKLLQMSSALGLEQTEKKRVEAQALSLTQDVSQRDMQLSDLNVRLQHLQDQVNRLSGLLSSSKEELSQTQIENEKKDFNLKELQQKLDAAMLEKMQELATYRSEFFGKLRTVLGEREDIKIVGDRFVFQSEVLFPSGSAQLSPAGFKQVKQLAQSLQDIGAQIPENIPWILRVDGHTDARPILHSDKFPTNWELSFARAMAVVRALEKNGIPAARLGATGFGAHQPLSTGKMAADYKTNRRIEFKLDRR